MDSSDHSDSNSDSEGDYNIPYLFKSALDVGSRFVDIVPDNELVFIKQLEGKTPEPTLFTQMTIRNVNTRAPVAFFVNTNTNTNSSIGLYFFSLSNLNNSKARLYSTKILTSYKHWLGANSHLQTCRFHTQSMTLLLT